MTGRILDNFTSQWAAVRRGVVEGPRGQGLAKWLHSCALITLNNFLFFSALKIKPRTIKLYTRSQIPAVLNAYIGNDILDPVPFMAAATVLPMRANNYVVEELIDWSDIPNDPIFQLVFPQPGKSSVIRIGPWWDLSFWFQSCAIAIAAIVSSPGNVVCGNHNYVCHHPLYVTWPYYGEALQIKTSQLQCSGGGSRKVEFSWIFLADFGLMRAYIPLAQSSNYGPPYYAYYK